MAPKNTPAAPSPIDYNCEIRKVIPHYDLIHEEILDLIEMVKPDVKHWLDTGCGTGNLITKAIKKFPKCQFYLSDPSTGMLDICQERFKNQPVKIIGKLPTHQVDMRLSPEVITAIQCHHYLNPQARKLATQRCYDLLKDNGLFITFENTRPNTPEGTNISLNRLAHYLRKQGKSEEEIEFQINRFDTNYFPLKTEQHIDLFKEIGFHTVELFWRSGMQAGFYAIKPPTPSMVL